MERRLFLFGGLFLHLILPMLFDDPRQPKQRQRHAGCAPHMLAGCDDGEELPPVPVPQHSERYSTGVTYERLPGRPAAMYVRGSESGMIRGDRRLVILGVDDGPGLCYSDADVPSHRELLKAFMFEHADRHLATDEGLACRDGATCPQCREMRALLAWFLDDDAYLEA